MMECFREDGSETTSAEATEGEEDITEKEEKIHKEFEEMDPAIERQLKKSKAKYRFESQNEIFNVSSRSIELAQQLAIEGEKRRRAEARPPRQGGIIKVN